MSKELGALEAFKRFRDNAKFDNETEYYLSTQYIDDSDIIETALKELKDLRVAFYKQCDITIELCKVLEIIKEKLVVGYDESENDMPCLVLGFRFDKDKTAIIYHTFDKEKIVLLKRYFYEKIRF